MLEGAPDWAHFLFGSAWGAYIVFCINLLRNGGAE